MAYFVNGNIVIDDNSNASSNAIITSTNSIEFIYLNAFYGYSAVGVIGPGGGLSSIERFPFATNSNAIAISGQTTPNVKFGAAGQSSNTHGYISAGTYPPAATTGTNIIDKFSFSNFVLATDVGDLTVARWYTTGQSSKESGYTSGGQTATSPVTYTNVIDKFPFASDANATDVGDLNANKSQGPSSGISSLEKGYVSSSLIFPGIVSLNYERFPFATNSNATVVGNVTTSRYYGAGQNSLSNGYTSGGTPGFSNVIDKFPFASEGNATDVGDLTVSRNSASSQSSSEYGYTSGGYSVTPLTANQSNVIDRFPFATNANATDVGDLVNTRIRGTGHQV